MSCTHVCMTYIPCLCSQISRCASKNLTICTMRKSNSIVCMVPCTQDDIIWFMHIMHTSSNANTTPTKAWRKVKMYLPNKPVKSGIRVFTIMGTKHCNVWNSFDNQYETGVLGPEDFCQIVCHLHTPYNKVPVDDKSSVKGKSPSALWVLQMGQQTKQQRDPSGSQVFFCDN